MNENVARLTRLRGEGRLEEAFVHADRAVAAAEGIVLHSPADTTAQWVLAGQLYERAALHNGLDQYALGAADAWRSFVLYQRLADQSPEHLPQRADAQARLAWTLACASAGTETSIGAGGSPRDHAAHAVATYEQLVAGDPVHQTGLARVHYLHGETLRVLTEEGTSESVAAYAASVRESRTLGPLTGQDLLLCASAALRLAYGHTVNEAHTDQRDAARDAVARYGELLNQGLSAQADYARALLLLMNAQACLDDPECQQTFTDFEYVLSTLPHPLPEDLAPIWNDMHG
ncbi:hypothetical protein [Streptomyces sp. NPDC058613]|uniref:hypothetical protein n=1 Tax=unclassified Streptomyces TaxID=2593676 RepID=UPI0036467E29